MARWKLTAKHYLSVPGITYTRTETSTTGRPTRQEFPVPMYLDPDAEGDWTHRPDTREAGMIVVTQGKVTDVRDIVFVGNPTPDMEPLDDEARELSAAMGWDRRKIVQGADFGENLVELFLRQQAETQSKQTNEVDDLRGAVAELTKTMAMFVAAQTPPQPAVIHGQIGELRRV